MKTLITSEPDSIATYFKKIWKYRNLIWVFAKRDLRVKYAQTFLGVAWTLLQPLTSMLIFSFFFGYLLKWQTNSLPFPAYVLSGLLGWNFFSYIVHSGSASIQESAHIIKKVYFPKSILPLSKVVIALVELFISLLILIPLLIYYQQPVSWKTLLVPFVLLFNAMCALSLVFIVAAFSFRKRDLFHLLPFLVYFGIWITPVFFSFDILPYPLRNLIYLNPMTSVIELWRWILFDYSDFKAYWLLSFSATFILCVSGMFFYNKHENKFSDYL